MRASEPIRRVPVMGAVPRASGTLWRRRRALIGGSSVAAVLVAWQAVGSRTLMGPDLISYPSEVLSVGASMLASGEMTRHLLVSLSEFAYGFPPAVLVGVALGLMMGLFRRFRHLLDPLIMALYTTPRIALIPLLVLWFGVGPGSKVAVVFLGGVFPVLVNTVVGVQQVDPVWVRAVRAFGASRLQVLVTVTLPGSLPAVMAGIRLGIGRAITGVIVGEMYVSLAGVGYLIQLYGNAGRVAELVFLVAALAAFGVLCVAGVRRCEDWVGPGVQGRER